MTQHWTTRVGRCGAACLAAITMVLAVPPHAAGQAAGSQPVAQDPTYEPQSGQEGKDVVWVPTPEAVVQAMLDIAQVTASDRLIDLGSGDGRTVIAAAQRGATARGIEYNGDMVELSRRRATEAGVAARATFEQADLFETDLSDATVITMFLLSSINLELRPTLLDLRPGTRIVSNTFSMGEWEADARVEVEDDCTSWCTALLWIIPAKVGGAWRVGDTTLTLTQEFQMVTGTLGNAALRDGRLHGDRLTFTVGDTRYEARVTGDTMEGTANGRPWRASRVQP